MSLLVLILILVVLLAAKVESSAEPRQAFIGNKTEVSVATQLRRVLNKEDYRILHDVTLPSNGNTKNTQIDLVILSKYGVFCIEVKAHKGWIFGSRKGRFWTHVLYKHKYKMYNPLRQNYVHVKALEKAIGGLLKKPIISLIVFPNAGKLKVDGVDNVGDYTFIVNKIQSYGKPIYPILYLNLMENHLKNIDIKDKTEKRAHVKEVKQLALKE